jgi:hypothetical protein
MKETAVSLIPKEQIEYLKEDEKFIEFIKNELTKKISERLIQILETSDEIIIKKPVLRIYKYQPTNSIEYRKTVDWEPLVRCKDCKWGRKVCGNIECSVDLNAPTEYHGYDWFCPNGERSEDGFCDKGEKKESGTKQD